MDTRKKIKTIEELHGTLERDAWTILIGGFEPVAVDMVALIRSLGTPERRLLVIVRSSDAALLDPHAQSALMAALRGVDAVVVETSDRWRTIIAKNPLIRVVDDRTTGERIRREFEELVISRQQGAAEA